MRPFVPFSFSEFYGLLFFSFYGGKSEPEAQGQDMGVGSLIVTPLRWDAEEALKLMGRMDELEAETSRGSRCAVEKARAGKGVAKWRTNRTGAIRFRRRLKPCRCSKLYRPSRRSQ